MTRNGSQPPGSAEKSLGEIVTEVTSKTQLLVREEIDLAVIGWLGHGLPPRGSHRGPPNTLRRQRGSGRSAEHLGEGAAGDDGNGLHQRLPIGLRSRPLCCRPRPLS